jgi:hypothetical protein
MTELPEEWKFLNQMPRKWDAPPELRTPPRSITINLVLLIVSSELAGNDVLEEMGRLLSSYASLNAWLSTEGASQLGFEGMAKVEAEISLVDREVYTAWIEFTKAFGPIRRVRIAEGERSALLLAIRNGTTRLDHLRQVGES